MPVLYGDLVSAPTRACIIFCQANQLPVEVKPVSLGAGDHKTPEHLALNPLGKMPFLVDASLKLPESSAIMCYLADKYRDKVATHWVPPPSDCLARAAFDSALHWWHTTIRAPCIDLLMGGVLAKPFGLEPNRGVRDHGSDSLRKGLQTLDSYWLGDKAFMAGDAISAADLLAACQIEMLRQAGDPTGPTMLELLEGLPRVAAWRDKVAAGAGLERWDAAHAPLQALANSLAQGAKLAAEKVEQQGGF